MNVFRRLVKEAVRSWNNTHLMDLPGTIRMSVDVYTKSTCVDAKDINNGLCMDFAEYVIDKCGGESDDLFAVDDTFFYVETIEEANENGWPDVIFDSEGGCWNKEFLNLYGYPKGGVDNAPIGAHGWIIFKNRHYDSEAPDGVDSPWDLPIFKRIAARKGSSR